MSTDQEKLGNDSKAEGSWKRSSTAFHDVVSKDVGEEVKYPADKGRYRLYCAYGCPWASRVLAMYYLKGLQGVLHLTLLVGTKEIPKDVSNFNENKASNKISNGIWSFVQEDSNLDEFQTNGKLDNLKDSLFFEPHGFKHIRDLYEHASPGYTEACQQAGKRAVYSVPILFDEETQTIVNNESSEIIRILNDVFNEWCKYPELDLNPKDLRGEMAKVDAIIYPKINDGVYRMGFATTQEAYNDAYYNHWDGMDQIEKLLGEKKYLCGDKITLSDIRLFVTLIRYDVAYFSAFMGSRNMVKDMPNMYRYLKDLYNFRDIAKSVNHRVFVKGYHLLKGKIYPLGPMREDALDHLKF